MKNIINIILFQLMLITFSNAQINVDVSNHSINIGETFAATINVKPNGTSIAAFTLSFFYDDALIEIQDIEQGNSFSGFYNDGTAGIINFTGVNTDGVENDFVALSITFEVISAASIFSNLEIIIEQIADENGSTLTYNKTNGLLNLNEANCVKNLFVGNANNPSTLVTEGIYQASECIESNGIITAKTPGEIVFKAGEKVNLIPGFEVQNNASFSIKMEDCGGQ